MTFISRPRLPAKKVCKRLERYFQNGSFSSKTVFDEILPTIDQLIMEAPTTFKNVQITPLMDDETNSVGYTRKEIATIIALMWYDLFDYDYMLVGGKEIANIDGYGRPDLQTIWNNDNDFCLDCLFNYFCRVREMSMDYNFDYQRVIYRRYHGGEKTNYTKCKMPPPNILVGEGDSDRSSARLHVIGASLNIGGLGFAGTFTHEEVVMMTRPECLLLLLLAPAPSFMKMNVVIGAEQMSLSSGIGTTVRYRENYEEGLSVAQNIEANLCVFQTANVFVPPSSATSSHSQFIRDFDGDLRQLQCAMESVPMEPNAGVSFGNWSYELNGSPPRLRVIQACIAAGAAQTKLCLYIADPDTYNELPNFVDWMLGRTVAEIYEEYKTRITEEWDSQGIHVSGIDHLKMIMGD